MTNTPAHSYTFNSPLEAGLRSLQILSFAHPAAYDLQKLLLFDHLVVHTADIGGPESLHPPVPMRDKEILVRRKLIESGIALMMSRNLIERIVDNTGITYKAGEMSDTFLESLTSPYFKRLSDRSAWVVARFGQLGAGALREYFTNYFKDWVVEFQSVRQDLQY